MTYKIEKVRPGVSSKRKFEDEDPIPYEIRKVWAAERLHNSSRGALRLKLFIVLVGMLVNQSNALGSEVFMPL